MTSSYIVFPRLPTFVSKEIHSSLGGKTLNELRALSQTTHVNAYLGQGTAFSSSTLAQFRDSIRNDFLDVYLKNHKKGVGDSEFDRQLGAYLFENLPLTPYEASHREVWNFLTLLVLPEVGPWRFPELTVERFVGPPIRNVLGRTWWRAYLLGTDLGSTDYNAEPLGEDELYTLVEKTTIGFNEFLVRRIASAIYKFQPKSTGRSQIVRELTKDLLRVIPWCDLTSFEDSELETFLHERLTLAQVSAKSKNR